jgi:hypothetical protein
MGSSTTLDHLNDLNLAHANQNELSCSGTSAVVIFLEWRLQAFLLLRHSIQENAPDRWNGAIVQRAIVVSPSLSGFSHV